MKALYWTASLLVASGLAGAGVIRCEYFGRERQDRIGIHTSIQIATCIAIVAIPLAVAAVALSRFTSRNNPRG